jgi:DNA polymerase III subunit epsilon
MRQVVLDTETTGLDPREGHRIIEIGCVEIVDRRVTRRSYHQYIKPNREIDAEAVAVHGITSSFLADKPVFAEIVDEFIEFIDGAELIIHNATFDVGFINHEFALLSPGRGKVADRCGVLDTLLMARRKYPGAGVSLDKLCSRLGIDNSHRELHGALLDAQILAEVYLAMTGGQTALSLSGDADGQSEVASEIRRLDPSRARLKVVQANEQELSLHEARLDALQKSAGKVLWRAESPGMFDSNVHSKIG